MNKEFIPYEEALALKKLGFNEKCFACFDEKQIFGLTVMSIKKYYTNSKEDTWNCAAPLYQQVFRWFREEHQLSFECKTPDGKNGKWFPGVHKVNGFGNYYDNDGFATYEEAQLACLKKLIEIVKNKENENNNQ